MASPSFLVQCRIIPRLFASRPGLFRIPRDPSSLLVLANSVSRSAGESSILEIRHGLVTLELRKDHGRGSILDRGLKIIEALKDCVFFSLSLVQQIKIRIFIFPFLFAEKWIPRRIFLVLNEGYRLLWIFNFSSLDNLRNNRNGKIKNRDRWVKQVGR